MTTITLEQITTTPAGRAMAERVFRGETGAAKGHAACLTDAELAGWLMSNGWTWGDVLRRES